MGIWVIFRKVANLAEASRKSFVIHGWEENVCLGIRKAMKNEINSHESSLFYSFLTGDILLKKQSICWWSETL